MAKPPGPKLTDKEEIAVALCLWRALRITYQINPESKCTHLITNDGVDTAARAVRLAKKVGCLDEYLKLTMVMPAMMVKCEELEDWDPSGPEQREVVDGLERDPA